LAPFFPGEYMKRILFAALFLLSVNVSADTPPPNSVKAKAYSGDGSQAIGNVSDALKVNLTNSSVATTGTYWQATQPVSASALPLPTGAATVAKQPALGTAGTPSADVITVQGVTSMTALKVDGSGVTQPTSVASLPLPSGASTEATLSTLNGKVTAVNTGAVTISAALPAGSNVIGGLTANQSVNVAQINGVTPLMGNGVTGTGSQRVTIASDNTAFTVKTGGRAFANAPTRYDYTGGSVTTAAYTQLVASTTNAASRVCIFDSSGQDLVLAVGAAASEVDQMGIFPGGNGCEELAIAASSRISIKAKSATASTGVILLNLYQ
jgi:hypothetical protein